MIDGLDLTWARPRAADLLSRAVGALTDMEGFMFQSSTSSAAGNEMRLTAERSLRTFFIALASINVVAATATSVGIFVDCYLQARRRDRGFSLKSSWLTIIGPKETLPYMLSLGIAIQGIIFAAAQSPSLGAVLTLGCTQTSQMMLPALFIVPYIQLVFGLEMTVRALLPQPFPRSPKWALPVCLGVITVALIITYGITFVTVPPNFCFAQLLWLVQRWAVGSFALLTLIAVVLLIGSLIICLRLYKSSSVSETQRTAASWTACYMLLALLNTVMLLPFFGSLRAGDTETIMRYQVRLSTLATVVVNLSGFLTGGLYLVLRFTRLGNFGGRRYFEFDSPKSAMGERSSTPGNSIYTKQLAQPVSPVRLEQTRRDIETGLQGRSEKMSGWPMALTAQSSRPRTPGAAMAVPLIMSPEMAFVAGPPPSQSAGPHNLFPPRKEVPDTKSSYPVPAAHDPNALSPDELLPPSAVWRGRHERKSSLGSSAMVQIALRVSNINDMPPGASPFQEPVDSDDGGYRAQPGLAISTDPFTDKASMLVDDDGFDFAEVLAQQQPTHTATSDESVSDDEITLSPTVYDPDQPSGKTRNAISGQWF